MRIAKMFLFLFSLSAFFTISVQAATPTEILVIQAVSNDSNEAKIAAGKLREMRQVGLDVLFEKYSSEINKYIQTGEKSDEWNRISSAIDNVAMQKDAYASHLFWLTDFEEAKRISKETGKPILSLRLLGNLNEEFSCANSRFFRAVLYSNKNISDFLRNNYILHWQSVRPAPRITIDFGDGRKIERTVTGNSIHYVLDENGAVVNALPGLYDPTNFFTFLLNSDSWLKQAKDFESGKSAGMNNDKINEKRSAFLKNMREREFLSLRQLANLQLGPLKLKFDKKAKASRELEAMPTAIQVAPIAVTKMSTEITFLRDIMPDVTKYGAQIDFESWKKVAQASFTDGKLDADSITFIRHQTGKSNLSEQEFGTLVSKLENLIALDTVRNNFLLRPTLLVWLNKDLDKNVDTLNKKVYDELFLTPNEDKWLGLYAPDIYTALDGNGITN
ncbi:MAG: hypothetical protein ABIP06_02445 [Pyrinomonadaceae bacterium]